MKINKNNAGFLMLEVMLAMGMIATVLLALLSYQITMLSHIERSHFKLIATTQFLNFSDMLLANQSDAQKNTAFAQWNHDNAQLLPQGIGRWRANGNHQCQITVQWVFQKPESISDVVLC